MMLLLLLLAGTTPWPQKFCPRLIYIVSISVESCTHCLLIEFFQSSGCVRRVLNHTAVLLCRRVQLNNLLIYADDINLCKLHSISACYPLVSSACLKAWGSKYMKLYIILYLCIVVLTLDAILLARSSYPEGPANGHLDTGFLGISVSTSEC